MTSKPDWARLCFGLGVRTPIGVVIHRLGVVEVCARSSLQSGAAQSIRPGGSDSP